MGNVRNENNAGPGVVADVANAGNGLAAAGEVGKYIAKWSHDKKVENVKKVKSIVYERVLAGDADILSDVLNVTADGKLHPHFEEKDLQIEGVDWQTGIIAIHLKNAANLFSGYLKSREDRYWLFRGANDDHQAYTSLHTLRSLPMLASTTLNFKLVRVLHAIHHGWFMLSQDDLAMSSSVPHMMHFKPTLISAMASLDEARKYAEYELYHQSSAQYLQQIYRASESIHLEVVPKFLLRTLSSSFIHPGINFFDFEDLNWKYQNNTLLQAILYIYMTQISKYTQVENIHAEIKLDKTNSSTVLQLIEAIDLVVSRRGYAKNSDEYTHEFIKELGRIKIESYMSLGGYYYATYYYLDKNHNKTYVYLDTGFASELKVDDILPAICRILRQAVATGRAYITQKDIYKFSRNFGDYGLYVTARKELTNVLNSTKTSLKELEISMTELTTLAMRKHNQIYAKANASRYQRDNIRTARQLLSTQMVNCNTKVNDNVQMLANHAESWGQDKHPINQRDEYEKLQQSVRRYTEVYNRSFDNPMPVVETPVVFAEAPANAAEQPPAAANPVNPQPNPVNGAAHEDRAQAQESSYTWMPLIDEAALSMDNKVVFLALLASAHTKMTAQDSALSKEQHQREKQLKDPHVGEMAKERLKPIYKERTAMVLARVGLFEIITTNPSYGKKDLNKGVMKFADNLKKRVKKPANLLESSYPGNQDKFSYKKAVVEAQGRINSVKSNLK